MDTMEVGRKLVALCREGKNDDAVETLYDKNIVSVEAAAMPNLPQELRGIGPVKEKNDWWGKNHIVHSAKTEGPFPNGDRFAVRFTYDITPKATGQRVQMDEVAVYTVKNGKIVREEFFYPT